MEKDETRKDDRRPETSTFIASTMRQGVRFFLHLAALYVTVNICSPWLAGTVYNFVMPALGISRTGSSFQFLFSHLVAFSFIPAFISGFINAKYRHVVALLVWTVPTAVLAYKFATFPASVFESRFMAALHHYFGGSFFIPEFHTYSDLFRYVAPGLDASRGMDQLRFTAPVYAGIAYSFGAWASRAGLLTKLFSFESQNG
jgi:hypothetical protein